MTPLAPNLFDRRFEDLLEAARSRLPSLAPGWTDYNLHDPGITLVELLAWVAEAQMYSLGHMRRDEREAYAALFGVVPGGPRPAEGLLWPDRTDPVSPFTSIGHSFVIGSGASVHTTKSEKPDFRPVHKTLWVGGRVASVKTWLAGGGSIDHTATSRRGEVPFLPFGKTAGPRDVLLIDFECGGDSRLFPADRASANGAYFVIGVRADREMALDGVLKDEPRHCRVATLNVALFAGDSKYPLHIVSDSTRGLTRTGVLVLDLSAVASSPQRFTLELRAPEGFERPPRLLRIEPNVLPIVQGGLIEREIHVGKAVPDQREELHVPGLRFGPGAEAIKVEIAEDGEFREWEQHRDLSDCGPGDRAYRVDTTAGAVVFGNGVNGRMPRREAQILISYPVCAGAAGNTARNQQWIVRGVSGVFGINPDAIGGGVQAVSDLDMRREARHRARNEHALVTAEDIERAALAIPGLEVVRARLVLPEREAARTGDVTLIAMRARAAVGESENIPESARWLAAIRRRLAPRMPLGCRLVVAAPRYVDFSIDAQLETVQGRDPAKVAADVRTALAERLSIADTSAATTERTFGADVTRRDLAAWIRAVSGVRRVRELRLRLAGGKVVEKLPVPKQGLPRLDLGRSTIEVLRPAPGSAR